MTAPGQLPAWACSSASAAAPSGVAATTSRSRPPIPLTGNQTPAVNISGKNTAVPIAVAIRTEGAVPATSPPTASTAASASR